MSIPAELTQSNNPLSAAAPAIKAQTKDAGISLPTDEPVSSFIPLPPPNRDESPSPLTNFPVSLADTLTTQPSIPESDTLASQIRPPPPPPPPRPIAPTKPDILSFSFPPSLNLYHYRGDGMPEGTYVLGEREDHPLYLCKATRRFLGLLASPMVIYSGPTDADPPLAFIKISGWSCTVSVGLAAGLGSLTLYPDQEVKDNLFRGGQSFTIEAGTAGNEIKERFEWRPSKSNAVAGLGGQRRGWKLVRMARGPPGGATLDFLPGNTRDSYGKEVVAVWTEGNRSSAEVGHFQFLGTGLTGALGVKWAIMAIITALALLEQDRAIAQRVMSLICPRKSG